MIYLLNEANKYKQNYGKHEKIKKKRITNSFTVNALHTKLIIIVADWNQRQEVVKLAGGAAARHIRYKFTHVSLATLMEFSIKVVFLGNVQKFIQLSILLSTALLTDI
jgi:hypothetical protein